MENKTKRFYKVGQLIWSVTLKKEVKVKSIDKENKEITVTEKNGKDIIEHTFKLWDVDILKYASAEKLEKKKLQKQKVTYFASVKGGVIPTKDEENAGRDAYARIEPSEDGKIELFLPKMQLTKIPLGFASYLDKKDLLSINWERSSTGALGILNMSGLIDSTYQGEVILQVIPLLHDILITNQVDEIKQIGNVVFYPYSKAVAQAVVLEQSQAKDIHTSYEDLLKKPSTRGTSGWGKSGK